MTDDERPMSSIRQDVYPQYKECSGKGCPNNGKHYLRIRFIRKSGWFCDSCKSSLLADGLLSDFDKKFKDNTSSKENSKIV